MEGSDKTRTQLIGELAEALERVNRLELLMEVSRTITSSLHLETILTRVTKLCCQAMNATSAYVCSVDLAAGTTTIIAEYVSPTASPKEKVSDLGLVYDINEHFPGTAEWARSADSHYIAQVDDPSLNARERQHLQEFGALSTLGVPLKSGDEFTGYIEIWESRRKRDFTNREVELLMSVAGQVNMVIANTHLYKTLREREDRYRVVSELVSDYAYRYELKPDGSWHRVWTSEEAFRRVTGYERSEIIDAYGLYHPDERERVAQDVQRTLEGRPTAGEYRIITKSGEVRWLYLRRQPEWDETAQRISGFYGAAQDITARKQMEIQLAYQAGLLHNVSDAVISADSDWNLISWNKGAEEMYGWTEEEVIGKNPFELFQTQYYDETTSQDAVQSYYDTGQWRGEAIHLCKNGKRLPVFISSSPVRDNRGNTIGTVAIIRDNTIQKQAEKHRTEMSIQRDRIQLLEELINDLSHDIKTPLTGINTLLYLLKKNTDRSKHEDYLERLEFQVENLARLLDDILTMSRLDRGAEMTFSPLNVNYLLENMGKLHRYLLDQKKLTLNLALEKNLPPVLGDEDELSRALTNLFLNAINYTPPDGSITIRTSRRGREIVIEIQDTGIGIAAGDLTHIFDRFYRADGARNSAQGGTGLGLAIAKRIIELHSGKIQARSTPGSGSTFSVQLPVSFQYE